MRVGAMSRKNSFEICVAKQRYHGSAASKFIDNNKCKCTQRKYGNDNWIHDNNSEMSKRTLMQIYIYMFSCTQLEIMRMKTKWNAANPISIRFHPLLLRLHTEQIFELITSGFWTENGIIRFRFQIWMAKTSRSKIHSNIQQPSVRYKRKCGRIDKEKPEDA